VPSRTALGGEKRPGDPTGERWGGPHQYAQADAHRYTVHSAPAFMRGFHQSGRECRKRDKQRRGTLKEGSWSMRGTEAWQAAQRPEGGQLGGETEIGKISGFMKGGGPASGMTVGEPLGRAEPPDGDRGSKGCALSTVQRASGARRKRKRSGEGLRRAAPPGGGKTITVLTNGRASPENCPNGTFGQNDEPPKNSQGREGKGRRTRWKRGHARGPPNFSPPRPCLSAPNPRRRGPGKRKKGIKVT